MRDCRSLQIFSITMEKKLCVRGMPMILWAVFGFMLIAVAYCFMGCSGIKAKYTLDMIKEENEEAVFGHIELYN